VAVSKTEVDKADVLAIHARQIEKFGGMTFTLNLVFLQKL